MKLKAKCRIGGVKILKRAGGKNSSKVKESEALAGDIYEGPQAHIDKGYAEAFVQESLDDTAGDDSAKQEAADEKAARIAELKQRAKELGASGGQLNIRSEAKLLELIEKLGEPAGEGSDDEPEGEGEGSDDELGLQ